MPELPEVETVKNILKKDLIGRQIKKVSIFYPNMIKSNLNDFKNKLINEKFIDIKRYGKWLVFETTNFYLVSHLRMEGKYYYLNRKENLKHEHVVFELDNNYYLRYKDVRKFGVMYLVNKDELFTATPLTNLGLEPFNDKLSVNYLKEKFGSKNTKIKTALLDQEIIAGLGNIYADEILFKSRISPFKKCNFLTNQELQKLIDNSKEILSEAIKCKGTTIRSYTSSLGVTGTYQDKLLVHTKKKCQICGSDILVKKINGRSTYYCLNCQGDKIE